jgi:NADPH:quinone reductase-like Zn-dependent oxidoreductase
MFAKFFKTKLPLIPGCDVAGTVEKTGSNVKTFKVGDAVFACLKVDRSGGYAEYAVAKESQVAAKPKSLNYIEAAAVPVGALTAWQALIDTAHLAQGQTVLIHGGSGGVGTFAIQIAKAKGAKVIATASTQNQDLLKQLGADVAIDYTKTKFEEVAKDVDIVLDTVGGETLARSYNVVKKGGHVVSIVAQPNQRDLEDRGLRGSVISMQPNAAELAEIGRLIDDKRIRVIVSQVLPLAEVGKAHAQVQTLHTRGKIVLKIAETSD